MFDFYLKNSVFCLVFCTNNFEASITRKFSSGRFLVTN